MTWAVRLEHLRVVVSRCSTVSRRLKNLSFSRMNTLTYVLQLVMSGQAGSSRSP
jgi:hypothetical protein